MCMCLSVFLVNLLFFYFVNSQCTQRVYDVELQTAGSSNAGTGNTVYVQIQGTSQNGIWSPAIAFVNVFKKKATSYYLRNYAQWCLADIG